ncbi:hypothetical protein Vafri_19302 [Volvox africanus]|uniref:Uncharacterized protein n=1 Tax=Volvox africanus TaxID=51714 RepID=A0A8J4BUB8_9CHLO|nr:hypothetical protein Vafri_19302 [Volvox africanus]
MMTTLSDAAPPSIQARLANLRYAEKEYWNSRYTSQPCEFDCSRCYDTREAASPGPEDITSIKAIQGFTGTTRFGRSFALSLNGTSRFYKWVAATAISKKEWRGMATRW